MARHIKRVVRDVIGNLKGTDGKIRKVAGGMKKSKQK